VTAHSAGRGVYWKQTYYVELSLIGTGKKKEDSKVTNIEIASNQTKRTIKTQNPKDKTITRNKETQMIGQHEMR